ncbi:MAG: hypothetical protein AAGN46_09025 [Acidobacteriota bacterium]
MPLLSGSASVSRFRVAPVLDDPGFDAHAFRAIAPGSETREAIGFVPIEPEAPYRAGHDRWFFRVRIDTLRADPTAVRERLNELVRTEIEQGLGFVGTKKRKQLKELAEEELILEARPRTKIVEGCLDGSTLWIGSTAKNVIGRVHEMLRRLGVGVDVRAPWAERGDPDIEDSVIETYEPGESVLGSRFLGHLVGDPDILVEPEAGLVRLRTEDARVTLSGAVLPDLHRYLERDARLLTAKLIVGESTFRFDALPFRVSALRVESDRHEHWTEQLDDRLEKIAAVYGLLDSKYETLAPKILRG